MQLLKSGKWLEEIDIKNKNNLRFLKKPYFVFSYLSSWLLVI